MGPIRLSRISFEEKALRLARYGVVLIGLSGGMMMLSSLRGDDAIGVDPSQGEIQGLPEPLTEENFAALQTSSPFLRSVGLSDSIVLTGMARIEGNVFATLFDTETTKSHVVSKTANPQGWQLVGIRGDEADLESLTAKVQVAGGEVISIRYEKLPQKTISRGKPGSGSSGGSTRLSSDQMRQAREAAINYKGEHPADGFPKLPPPEVVQKLSRLNVQQRESINREMIELRNRGLGLPERAKIYVDKIDRTLRGGR